MKYLTIAIFTLFLSIAEVNGSGYETFRENLVQSSNRMHEAVGLIDRGRIYSKQVIANSLFLTENKELLDAGRDLIAFLERDQKNFYRLSFADWLSAVNDLLVFDDWNSTKIAYGNLVIKYYITNLIIRSIHLRMTKSNLDKESLNSIVTMIKRLRRHLPSSKAMFEVGLIYYGHSKIFDVDRLDYVGLDIDRSQEAHLNVWSKFMKYIRSDKRRKSDYEQNGINEFKILKNINSQKEFYDKPVPWLLEGFSKHREFLWNLYFYALMNTRIDGGVSDWSSISEEDVDDALKGRLQEEIFWMTQEAQFFVEDKHKMRQSYLQKIREDGGLTKLNRSWPDGNHRGTPLGWFYRLN